MATSAIPSSSSSSPPSSAALLPLPAPAPAPAPVAAAAPPTFLSPSSSSSSPEWPHKAVSLLLDTYLQKFSDGRGFLRGNDWEEVRSRVNTECEGLKTLKTVKQCKDKIDSLKRRYKSEKRRAVNGNAVTWPFFSKLDKLMGSVFKQVKLGHESLDVVHKQAFCYSDEDKQKEKDDDYGNEHDDGEKNDGKQGFSGFPEEGYGANGRYSEMPDVLANPKIRSNGRENLNARPADDRGGGIAEEGFFNLLHSQAPLKLLSLTGAQLSGGDSNFLLGGPGKAAGHSLLQCEPGHPLLEAWKPAGHPMQCEPGHPLLESWKPAGHPLLDPWKPPGHSLQCEPGNPMSGAWKPSGHTLHGIESWKHESQPEPKPKPKPKPESKPQPEPEFESESEPEPEPEAPMQALVDALAGFSEVYARVEIAKMEIFTSLKLRLAKLKRRRRRQKRERKVHSSG